MKVTVKTLLQAIQHCGLSENDEIVFRSKDGEPVSASIEVGHASKEFFISVGVESEIFNYDDFSMSPDCDCGEGNCHYCG